MIANAFLELVTSIFQLAFGWLPVVSNFEIFGVDLAQNWIQQMYEISRVVDALPFVRLLLPWLILAAVAETGFLFMRFGIAFWKFFRG